MIGGFQGPTSRLVLAVIVGTVGAAVFVQKPVRAADLGGDCCADLEERVAELEATTARKGNKTWGEVRLGLTATPKYDITKDTMEYISTETGEGGGLSDTMVADFRMNDSFRLRPKGFDNAEGLSSLSWSNIARCYSSSDQFNCSTRRNGVAYWSPTWSGFSAS